MRKILIILFMSVIFSVRSQNDFEKIMNIIKTNDIVLFDKTYPSIMKNKEDKFIDLSGNSVKVLNRRITGISMFEGIAFSIGLYLLDKELIMLEATPAHLTFSKKSLDEIINTKPVYSLIEEKGSMVIHNEYYLYNELIINTWRPTKEYNFKNTEEYGGFVYTPDDIYFLTITKKYIFEEMIEPYLKIAKIFDL